MKKLFFAFLVLACFVKDGKTCVDIETDFSKSYLLTPEVITDSTYWPFVFCSNWYYSIPARETEGELEWSDYLKGSLAEEDIFCLMQSIDTSSINKALTSNQKSYLGYNLRKPKIKQFFEFLLVSERNSYLLGNDLVDKWNYNSHLWCTNRKEYPTLLAELKSNYEKSTSPFLKNRYWYQLVRFHFYRSSLEVFDQFFKATSKLQPRNSLYYAALDKYLNKPNRAIDICKRSVEIYDEGKVERFLASKAFYPCTQEMFDTMLSVVKTDHERESLWAMFGYFVDEYEAIDQINRINPNSEKLDFLLCRLINKMEVDRYSNIGYYYDQTRKHHNVKELSVLVDQQLKRRKLKNPANWILAKGYLEAFSGKYSASNATYQKIDRSKVSDLFKKQLEAFEYFNKVHLYQHWGKAEENEFLAFKSKFPLEIYDDESYYYYYEDFLSQRKTTDLYVHNLYDVIRKRIAELYQRQGEFEKAMIVGNKAIYFSSTDNLKRLKSFWKIAEQDSFFAPFLRSYSWDDFTYNNICYYYATNLFFDGKYSEAAKELKHLEFSKDTIQINPFRNSLYSYYQLSEKSTLYNRTFTKYTFLCTMDSLFKIVSQKSVGQTISERILLIKGMMSMGINTRTYAFHILPEFIYIRKNEVDETIAEKLNARKYNALNVVKPWLMDILQSNASAEEKAFCSAQLAELDFRNYLISIRNTYDFGEIPHLIKPWKGFNLLLNSYSKTRVYSNYLEECTYFQEFVTRRKMGI